MRTETIAEALRASTLTVLETMFFAMPDGEAKVPWAYPPGERLVCATVAVTGDWSGRFQLTAPQRSMRTLAESFTGVMSPEEIGDEKVGEVVRELCNMICGSTLGHLADDRIFDLGSPVCYCTEESVPEELGSGPGSAACGYELGDGVLTVQMALRAT